MIGDKFIKEFKILKENLSVCEKNNIILSVELDKLKNQNLILLNAKNDQEKALMCAIEDFEILKLENTNLKIEITQKNEALLSQVHSSTNDKEEQLISLSDNQNFKDEILNYELKLKELNEKIESIVFSNDIIVNDLELQLAQAKKSNEALVNKFDQLRFNNDKYSSEIERLKRKEITHDSLASRCKDLETSNSNLHQEVKAAIRKGLEISNQLRVCTKDLDDKNFVLNALQVQVSDLTYQVESKDSIINDNQLNESTLNAKISSLLEKDKVQQEIIENLNKERDFLRDEIEEVLSKNKVLMNDNELSQQELFNSNTIICDLRNTINQLQEDKIKSASKDDHRLEELNKEIDSLKNQLSNSRMMYIKNDLDSQVNDSVESSRFEKERSKQEKKVYEKLINDLRDEVETLRSSTMDSSLLMSQLQEKANTIANLEEELAYHKEFIKSFQEKNNNLELSINETFSQKEKSSDLINKYVYEIQRLQSDLEILTDKLSLKEQELSDSKASVKRLEADKYDVDSKSSNLILENMKIASRLEEANAKIMKYELEINKYSKELETVSNDCIKLENEIKDNKKLNIKTTEEIHRLTKEVNNYKSKEEMHGLELNRLAQSKGQLELEIDSLRGIVGTNKSLVESKQQELSEALQYIESITKEFQNLKNQLTSCELQISEARLQQLSKDVNDSIADEDKLNRIRWEAENSVMHLKLSLSQEQENSTHYKSQVHTLEDKLSRCLQELEVFKSLDIYKYSLHSELSNHKKDPDIKVNSNSIQTISESNNKPKKYDFSYSNIKFDSDNVTDSKPSFKSPFSKFSSSSISTTPSSTYFTNKKLSIFDLSSSTPTLTSHSSKLQNNSKPYESSQISTEKKKYNDNDVAHAITSESANQLSSSSSSTTKAFSSSFSKKDFENAKKILSSKF